jgi:hypothetical protein
MEPTDITDQTLRDIRDGVNQTHERLDRAREETNAIMEDNDDRLSRIEHRLQDAEIRLAMELVAVACTIREVRDELREDRRVHAPVDGSEPLLGVAPPKDGKNAAH